MSKHCEIHIHAKNVVFGLSVLKKMNDVMIFIRIIPTFHHPLA